MSYSPVYRANPISASPLLNLPQELQDQILTVLLGNSSVNIEADWRVTSRQQLDHHFSKLTVRYYYKDDKAWTSGDTRHSGTAELSSLKPFLEYYFRERPAYQGRMGVFWTCRHLHTVATRIFFSTNTFCMAEMCRGTGHLPTQLLLFARKLSSYQSSAVRSLHLRVRVGSKSKAPDSLEELHMDEAWNKLFGRHEPGLENLEGL